MDEFFQILFYLIIIFVFLNSLFKKKDKEQTRKRPSESAGPQQPDNYPSTGMNSGQNPPQEHYDILKEIDGLFKDEKTSQSERRKIQSAIEEAEMRSVPVEEHIEDKEWHTEDKEWHSENKEWHSENKEWHSESEEWHEESKEEHELDKSWHRMTPFKRTQKIDKTIEKEAEKFKQMLEGKHDEVSYALGDLRKNLYSPQSLKEYIVISEILGKPKYLRR